MITGHAAGTAAALASKGVCRLRQLDIQQLQSTLKEQKTLLEPLPQ